MSDSDDDLPISELIKKRKRLEQAALSATVKKEITTKPTKKTETRVPQTSSSRSNTQNRSAEFYDETQKGMMTQRFLVRWWYAMQWPKEEEIGEPPAGYEPLDGFKGVFICTTTESLGTILDLRNKETCPNLRNISKMSSARIKELCIEAYQKQMEAVIDHEGPDSKLLRTLKSELAEVKKVDVEKADREAKKFVF